MNITINAAQPGLLAPSNFKVGGNQYVVAQHSDGTYVLPADVIAGLSTRPAQPGETIVIYGVGFGSVTPTIPAGEIAGATIIWSIHCRSSSVPRRRRCRCRTTAWRRISSACINLM